MAYTDEEDGMGFSGLVPSKDEAKHDKAVAELRAIKRDLARIRDMPVNDRFDKGCQRMAFLYFANAILGER